MQVYLNPPKQSLSRSYPQTKHTKHGLSPAYLRPHHPHPPYKYPPHPPPNPHHPMASSSLPPPLKPRIAPPIWSHDETLTLIESYRRKWHSLSRPNLRSSDWDDVASDLSVRSPLLPSKTPVQCRHKIEKLRKRFRSDRRRSLDRNPLSPPASSWPFFPLMESLDCPPGPHGELLRFVIPKAVRSKGKRKGAGDGVDGIVVALRMVGDGFMRMERVKLDMARETLRMRMEMELKRTQMILDSQRRILDAFLKGVGGGGRRKKGKVSPDCRVSDE